MVSVQTTCALGIVRDFKELAKYNLRMLTSPELEKKPPSSKETSSKPEADTLERPAQEDAPDVTAAADKLEERQDVESTVIDVKPSSDP